MTHPWMKFYPTDWRGEQSLRAVSLAARGLWIECLMIMHEANPYGHLVLGAQPVSNDVLSRMVGTPLEEIEQLIAELEKAGVFSRTGRGVIYSRRMTKDRQKANKCRKAVKLRYEQTSDVTTEKSSPNRSPRGSPRGPPSSQSPEARSQRAKPSTPELQDQFFDEEIAPRSANGAYAFEYGCVKLSAVHLGNWEKAFPDVAVTAELIAAEPWLRKQKNWFAAAASMLAKREREAVLAIAKAAAEGDKPKEDPRISF